MLDTPPQRRDREWPVLCTPRRNMFGQRPVRVLFQLPEQHAVLLRLEDAWWTAWDGSWSEWLLLSMESPIAFYSGETDLKLSSNFRLADAVLYGVYDPLSKVKAVAAHTSHYPFNPSENRCEHAKTQSSAARHRQLSRVPYLF